MIRILESKTTDVVGKYWYYLLCDEGDTKPTGEFPADSGKTIANGSRLFENGTEIRYEYNNGSWTAVGQQEVTLVEKSITENGEYNPASDNADGYSGITVNVPAPALTGFGECTFTDSEYVCVYIGYKPSTPTIIEAVAWSKTGEPPSDLIALGKIEYDTSPDNQS